MSGFKSVALGVALVALVGPLCVDWTQAQKTIKNSFQQTISSGSGPESVYGGYRSQQAPVARPQVARSQQTYASRQRSQTVQQPAPVYQQQESSAASSSSYEQSAEADAEPASYGKRARPPHWRPPAPPPTDHRSANRNAHPHPPPHVRPLPTPGSVSGQPGRDFPAYTRVPKTSFSCDGLPYEYGMYADEETGCQAYHVCYNGRRDSFLCGVGTVFNQRILHCDYWYSVDCGKSSQYYSSNAYMGSSQPEPGPAQAQQSSSSYQRTQVSSSSVNRPVQVYQQAQSSSFNRNTQQQVQEAY